MFDKKFDLYEMICEANDESTSDQISLASSPGPSPGQNAVMLGHQMPSNSSNGSINNQINVTMAKSLNNCTLGGGMFVC